MGRDQHGLRRSGWGVGIGFEFLESRQLLSTSHGSHTGKAPVRVGAEVGSVSALAAGGGQQSGGGSVQNGTTGMGSSGGSSSGGSSGGSTGPMIPTPYEVTHSRYSVVFPVSYTVGPGRFSNQLSQTTIKGTAPSWDPNNSLFLGISLFTPSDPSQSDTIMTTIKGPHLSGSDSLSLNMTVQPASTDRVLPTHLTWTVDSMGSMGIYGGATGQGIANIRYSPSHGGPHAQHGTAVVTLQGLVFRTNSGQLT